MQHRSSEQENPQHLILESKHTAWIVSGIVLGSFFIFMAGYFLGKQRAVEQFSASIEQTSLADKISASLYATYEGKMGGEVIDSDFTTQKTE